MTDYDLAAVSVESYRASPDITGYGPFRGTNAIVRPFSDATVIGFRGTDDPGDWLMDMMAAPALAYAKTGLTGLCIIHRGFLVAALSVYSRVKASIAGRDCVLTGHSLGGAVALVVGAFLRADGTPPKEIVTFGAPRVGFAAFAEALADIPVRQYRRGNDPVTTLPVALSLFPYRHVRLPLLEVGKPDDLSPFASHHMAGYFDDVTAYLKGKANG